MNIYMQNKELNDYYRTEQKIARDETAARQLNDALNQRRLFARMFALTPEDVSRLALTAEQELEMEIQKALNSM